MRIRLGFVALLAAILLPTLSMAQGLGRIRGRVVDQGGTPLSGVVVAITGSDRTATTDNNGEYSFAAVAPGTYSLAFTLADFKDEQAGVVVAAGQSVRADKKVDWQVSFAESITVFSASRRPERLVDAPAAITVVTQEDIARTQTPGQAPKLLETAPGVDFTQSGLYDFNFNARGFNSSLNRRILTLIDGRDPSVPFLGAMEWAALSFPVDEYASIELVRGPGAALYGANAFNGVLNMTTKQPRYAEGGRFTATGGELATSRGDLRLGYGLGNDWFFKLTGGYQNSDDFARSRNVSADYGVQCTASGQVDCLPREAVPLAKDKVNIGFGGLRFDKYFAGGEVGTIEGGYASISGPVFQTGIGRVQVTDVKRPWARANYNTPHWNVLTYYDARKAVDQVALASGAKLFEDSNNFHGEVQGNWSFSSQRGRIIGGVSYHKQNVDTANNAGFQTLLRTPERREHTQAAFGQFEYDIAGNLKVVLAGRYDDGSLYDSQWSPKASLVWGVGSGQTLRLTYNQAFQVPNYSEFFLAAPAGAPVNLAAVGAGGLIPLLGAPTIPILARGNPALGVEKIKSYEAGWSGIFGNKAFVTLDYYYNQTENFVTDLLPGVNSEFAPYQPNAALPPAFQAAAVAGLKKIFGPRYGGVTNLANGAPALIFSYANAGKVDEQGVELAMNYYLNESWVLDGNYSYFDYTVKKASVPGDQLLPNAPTNKFNLGLSFRQPRWDVTLKYRWVDGFRWAAGVFVGNVPQYDVVNLNANFRITDHISFGLAVANALNNDHWEAWGGDIIKRRALGSLTFNW
ncbi:MAG: TonB-dependent receptor [Acidobacteriota bacterium]